MQTIDRIVSTVNRRVDESNPMVDARLPTGERVNVIIPPLSLIGPTLTIRRFPRAFTLDELIGMGSLDETAPMLLRGVRPGPVQRHRLRRHRHRQDDAAQRPVRRSSRPRSGSSPSRTPPSSSSSRRTSSGSRARPPNVEGKGQVTIRDLVRNSLRMRPDRIIVGEVRGGETLDMLQAMNTGHDGSLATVHANSAEDAIDAPADAGLDERRRDPLRGAARPDQQRRRRHRPARSRRRRPPADRRDRRRSSSRRARTSAWRRSCGSSPTRSAPTAS